MRGFKHYTPYSIYVHPQTSLYDLMRGLPPHRHLGLHGLPGHGPGRGHGRGRLPRAAGAPGRRLPGLRNRPGGAPKGPGALQGGRWRFFGFRLGTSLKNI